MKHPGRREEWEKLLREPVAAVAKVRFTKDQTGAVGPLLRGTAVLTTSRFLLFGGMTHYAVPKEEKKLRDNLRLQFPRNNITEVVLSDERKNIFLVRYIEGKEKKVCFRPDSDGNMLIKLMEQDLSEG